MSITMSNAIPNDVIQKVVKPHMTALMIVESVTDDAVMAYIPMSPERYRVKHDDYAVIGQAAVINPAAIQETPPAPLPEPRNGTPARADQTPRPRSTSVRIPGRPFEQFRKIQVNPDIVPDGAPVRPDRPKPDAPVTPSLADMAAPSGNVPFPLVASEPPPAPVGKEPPVAVPTVPQEPKRKRKVLE